MPTAPPALCILADSGKPRSIRSLAEHRKGNYRSFVKAAHNLEEQGAVQLQPHGRELLVTATSSRLTGLSNELLRPRIHPGLKDIFYADRPQMLLALHSTRQVDLTAELMAKSPGAVRYMIRLLQSKGLIVKNHIWYRIHPQHRTLIDLLRELDRIQAETRLARIAPKARLVWHLGPDLLFHTEDAPPGAQLAGLDAFNQYGIPIQTKGPPLYYVGNRTLTAADILLQPLVTAGYTTPFVASMDSPVATGPEFNYACLLWEKEEPKDIWPKSDLYFDQENQARDVVEYVHEKGDWAGFLPWSEHERLRKMYGVRQ